MCEDNGGIKVSVEETWKNILKDVDYKEWVGGEIDELNVENKKDEETQERDELEETADASNVDGMVLSNLDEDCTVQDIKNILKGSMNEADLEKITVHPAGSTRSKLIKDIKQNIGSLARRIEVKSFGGRLIHCRPHVPISPVKPSEINVQKQKPMDSPKVDKSVKPKTNKVNTSGIPGLAVEDQEKAKKQAAKILKQLRAKEIKESKVNKAPTVMKDFLLNPLVSDTVEGFTSTDYNDSDEEYEDSKEEVSEGEEGTVLQKHLKSFFVESPGSVTPSVSTPVPPTGLPLKRAAQFANLSPIDNKETNKKPKSRK